jgi:hypothetical protein
VPALCEAATEHTVAKLRGPEVPEHVAARELDVEGLAREEIQVERAVVGEGVTARVALRQKDDARDRRCAVDQVLGQGGRGNRCEPKTDRKVDKRFSNTAQG